jgi:nicotinamidase/pyrazinamidase
MTALIIVDLQNDFMPGGALGVNRGEEIVSVINDIINLSFDLIVATKDWHPLDHISFADNHHKNPGDQIDVNGVNQILWPRHCVQGSKGAEFVPGWRKEKIDKIIYKGTEKNIDSYSTFFDNGHCRSTGLEDYLRSKGIKHLYISGLATDYCVKYSVLDALKLGFNVYVILDACRAVNLEPDDEKKACEEMKIAGARFVLVKELMDEK